MLHSNVTFIYCFTVILFRISLLLQNCSLPLFEFILEFSVEKKRKSIQLYLFEFDIGSPATSDEENNCDYDQDSIMNVVEDATETRDEKRTCSMSSDTSSSNCSHRKESGVVVDGFASLFGSTSSGVPR